MNREAQRRENSTQWTSLSSGSNFQHYIFYAFIRLGGRKAVYTLPYGIALYFFLFRPSIRKKADDYLRRRFE